MCSTKQVILSFAYIYVNKEVLSAQCESPTNTASFSFESLVIIQQYSASVDYKRKVHPATVNSRLREKLMPVNVFWVAVCQIHAFLVLTLTVHRCMSTFWRLHELTFGWCGASVKAAKLDCW